MFIKKSKLTKKLKEVFNNYSDSIIDIFEKNYDRYEYFDFEELEDGCSLVISMKHRKNGKIWRIPLSLDEVCRKIKTDKKRLNKDSIKIATNQWLNDPFFAESRKELKGFISD